jgi:signal transduction histidine kinase
MHTPSSHPAISTPEHELAEFRLNRLIGQAPVIFIASLASTSALFLILWDESEHSHLFAWVAYTQSVNFLGMLLLRSVTGQRILHRNWSIVSPLYSIADGAAWGGVVLLFLDFEKPIVAYFISAIALGIAAGGPLTRLGHFPSVVAFNLAILIPMGIRIGIEGGPLFFALAALVAVYGMVLLSVAYGTNQYLIENIKLSYELKKSNRSLESKVDARTAQLQAELARREAVETELRRSKDAAETANRTKNNILANLSHELRTPLNAILGFAEIMQLQTFGPLGSEKYREYLKDISLSGTHLKALIDDLLDMSRIDAGAAELRDEEVDLHVMLGDVRAILEEPISRKHIDIIVDLAPGCGNLLADPVKLRQILINLIGNAIKFSPPQSAITITAQPHIGGGLELTIADQGNGMSKQDLDVVFEPFRRGDATLARLEEGSGLGLPLVKALVELHGAVLNLESEPGHGTHATIQWPAERVLKRLGEQA